MRFLWLPSQSTTKWVVGGCFNNRNVLSPSPEAGVDQDVCRVGSLWGLGGTICLLFPLAAGGFLVITGVSWLAECCLNLHVVSFLSVSTFPPFCKDTSCIWLEVHLSLVWAHLNWSCSWQACFQIRPHSEVPLPSQEHYLESCLHASSDSPQRSQAWVQKAALPLPARSPSDRLLFELWFLYL